LVAAFASTWIATGKGQAPAPQAATFAPGEVLVKFRTGSSNVQQSAALASVGGNVLHRYNQLDIQHVALPNGVNVASALMALRANANILYAEPNYTRQAVASPPPNDPFWLSDNLWGLQKIQAQAAWVNFSHGDGTIVVADIDTGINYNHPDLAANVWVNPLEVAGNGVDDDHDGYIDDVHGINVLTGSGDPMDDNGHGTHTAGTLGAVGNNGIGVVGINWNVKILSCKFLDSSGSGFDAGAIACFNYVLALKSRGVNIRVTSNSWGSPRGASPIDSALKDAIDAVGAAGIINIFAAGNNGTNNDVAPFDPASFPSASIVSVAASDSSDNKASFSNYGPTTVDLAAPGVNILSTYGAGYATLSGTSMATPHVAGAAALVAAINPTLTVAELKNVLLTNVDLLGTFTGLVSSGGRLNVFAAGLAAASAGLPASVTASPSTVNPGGTITGTVSNGPGNALDWIGLYCPASLGDASFIDWRYLNNTKSPPASGLTNATVTFTAPNSPGSNCNLRFFSNNGFTTLATSATISIAASSASAVTASPSTVTMGATITGTVSNGPGNALDWVGLYCPASLADASFIDWRYLNNTKSPPASGLTNATVTFTAPNNPGSNCNLRFFSNNGLTNLATSATIPIGAQSVTVSPSTVTMGATITGTVSNGPGNALDWVGLYCPASLADASFIDWRYLNNTKSPPAPGLTNATVTFTAPNSPGSNCNLRFFSNNGFTNLAASATISIQ
jgi:subtilisin family serine protease